MLFRSIVQAEASFCRTEAAILTPERQQRRGAETGARLAGSHGGGVLLLFCNVFQFEQHRHDIPIEPSRRQNSVRRTVNLPV